MAGNYKDGCSGNAKRNYQREMEQILQSLSGCSAPFEVSRVGGSSVPGESSVSGGTPQTSNSVSGGVENATDYTKSPQNSAPESGTPQRKPTLLLHACCGPCSSYCLETLVPFFNITIYYYNPNISPQQEYERRLTELEKFLARFPAAVSSSVKLVEAAYNPEDFYNATNVRNEPELATEPERGERCRRCYELRMRKAYEYACANGFDWFTTTLSISPHKDAEKINTIGFALETARNRTRFLPSDFKKKNGFLRSTQLTEEYGMWRQDYCGCIYSARKTPQN